MDHLTEIVRKEHLLFDARIDSWIDVYQGNGGHIFCGRGCSNCCTLAVNTTWTEALCVAESLSGIQAARLKEHAGRLLGLMGQAHDLKSYLRLQRQVIGNCPFLSADGSCGVYASRPFSCRSLIATKESRFCGLDFSTLTPEQKSDFMASLDRSVVAFPMHYVADLQNLGQSLETRASQRMQETFGFSIYGDLPFLVYLELEHGLSEMVTKGSTEVRNLLQRRGLNHPFLVMLEHG